MILAGGASRRFGGPKGLARLNGTRLVDIVQTCIRAQTTGPLALNAAADGPYASLGLRIIPDSHANQPGPLAGLYAAMNWAAELGHEHVVTVPVDLPFLPANLVTELHNAGAPAIAASAERKHPAAGLWSVSLKGDLDTQIKSGMRAAHAWVEHCKAAPAHFEPNPDGRDPFFNINTPADLAEASRA